MKKNNTLIAILLIYLYLPIFLVILFSFSDGYSMSQFGQLTLENYTTLFTNERLLVSLFNSLFIAFISSLIALIVGLVITFSIYFSTNKVIRKFSFSVNNILLISPDIVIGIALLLLFTFLNIKFGLKTVMFAHIIFSVPIVLITVYPKLKEIPDSELKAAYDLGANKYDILVKIFLPVISNTIIFTYIIMFIYSIDDFGVTYFVTGNGFTTLPVEIYSMVRRGVSLDVNALFAIIFLVMVIIIILYSIFDKKQRGEE